MKYTASEPGPKNTIVVCTSLSFGILLTGAIAYASSSTMEFYQFVFPTILSIITNLLLIKYFDSAKVKQLTLSLEIFVISFFLLIASINLLNLSPGELLFFILTYTVVGVVMFVKFSKRLATLEAEYIRIGRWNVSSFIYDDGIQIESSKKGATPLGGALAPITWVIGRRIQESFPSNQQDLIGGISFFVLSFFCLFGAIMFLAIYFFTKKLEKERGITFKDASLMALQNK